MGTRRRTSPALQSIRVEPVLRRVPYRFVLAVAAGVLAWVQVVPASSQTGEAAQGFWRKIPGPARYYHTATLLPTGKVLVAGGCEPAPPGTPACVTATDEAEIFDPATATWSPAGRMTVPRTGHTATVLPGGDVLVVGGCSGLSADGICDSVKANSAERYDSAAGTWAKVGGFENTFLGAFRGQTATLQPDGPVSACGATCGRVVVIGSAVALIWDPATATSAPTATRVTPHGSLFLPLINHSTTQLPGGRLVVVASELTAIYDPASDSWGAGKAPSGRDYFSASLLQGQVLVTGGVEADGSPTPFPDLYEPDAVDDVGAKGRWRPVDRPAVARFAHAAAELVDGEVLVAGGRDVKGNVLAAAEVYRASTGRWRPAGVMSEARGASPLADSSRVSRWASLTTTALTDGRVLAVGGNAADSADLYGPVSQANLPSAGSPPGGTGGRGPALWWALGLVPAALVTMAVLRWRTKR